MEEEFFIPLGEVDSKSIRDASPIDATLGFIDFLLKGMMDGNKRDQFKKQVQLIISSNSNEDEKQKELGAIEAQIEQILTNQAPGRFGQRRISARLETAFTNALKTIRTREKTTKELKRLFDLLQVDVEKAISQNDQHSLLLIRSYLSKLKRAAESRSYENDREKDNTIRLLESASSSIRKIMIFKAKPKRS
jgi:hypothetical protein